LKDYGRVAGQDATHLTNREGLVTSQDYWDFVVPILQSLSITLAWYAGVQLYTINVQLNEHEVAPAAMYIVGKDDSDHVATGLFLVAITAGPDWRLEVMMVDDAAHEHTAIRMVFGGKSSFEISCEVSRASFTVCAISCNRLD
jgi:hypothetical protein